MKSEALIEITFPTEDYTAIKKNLQSIRSFNYNSDGGQYLLGKVRGVITTSSAIEFDIEIRKDETPAWYLDDILKAANGFPIIIKNQDQTKIATKGKITSKTYSQPLKKSDVVSQITFKILKS